MSINKIGGVKKQDNFGPGVDNNNFIRVQDLNDVIDAVNAEITELASDIVTITPSYKKYVALLTQTGTDAPVATVLENSLGTVSFTYVNVGIYNIVATGLLTLNKTVIKMDLTVINGNNEQWLSGSIDAGTLTVNGAQMYIYDDADAAANSVLLNTPIEIIVYE